MKKLFTVIAIALLAGFAAQAQNNLGIGTPTPHASAALDVTSTTQGMLVPRMDSAQRSQIATPATGLLVYQTNGVTPGFYFYTGTTWTSLSGGGGTSLPSQTGNAGKVLTTDGTNLSWGLGVGTSFEVYATIATAQTTIVGSSLALPSPISFSGNTAPAALTGNNVWENTTDPSANMSTGNNNGNLISKFTAKTAGLYFVDVQLASDNTTTIAIPMLDYNGLGNVETSYYGTGSAHSVTAQSPYKSRGVLQRLIYMNANDFFYVRALPSSSAAGNSLLVSKANYIKIVRLK